MGDFYKRKVIAFDEYLTINFNYNDVDIILKSLELFCYNMKNVYLLKMDRKAVNDMSYRINLLYNLIQCSYTRHVDKELEKKKKKEEKNIKEKYYQEINYKSGGADIAV